LELNNYGWVAKNGAKQEDEENEGILNSVYNWFVAKPAESEEESKQASPPKNVQLEAVLSDKKFI